MTKCLTDKLLELARLLGQLDIAPEKVPLPVTEVDLQRWRSAKEGETDWLGADGGESLRTLLKLLREHADVLDGLIWQSGATTDLAAVNRSLTDAAAEACGKWTWLALRLALLRRAQAEEGQPEIVLLLEKFNLDIDRLGVLRDALILTHTLAPDGEPGAVGEADDVLGEAVASLHQPLGAARRKLLAADSAVRQAMERVDLDADACLAVETAAAYAHQRRRRGQARTAAVADLLARLLVTDGPGKQAFPEADWDRLKLSLVDGQTDALAELAETASLARIMLAAMHHRDNADGPPSGWLAAVRREYWRPFADTVLRPGPLWIAEVLTLGAAVRALVDGEEARPSPVARYEWELGLTEPPIGTELTPLQAAVAAVEAFDADAFAAAVPADRAERAAVEVLANPPATTEGLSPAVPIPAGGLQEPVRQEYERRWARQPPASGQVEMLRRLLSAAMASQAADHGRLLEALGQWAALGAEKRELVACFVRTDDSVFASVATAAMLEFLQRHQEWLAEYVPVTEWLGELRRGLYEQLSEAVGPAAASNPHSGLNVVWALLCGETTEADVLKNYRVDRPGLDRLRSAFCDGALEPLAEELPLLLHTATVVEPATRWEKARQTSLRTISPLRLYILATLLLIVGYLWLHVTITDGSAMPGPPATAAPGPPGTVRQVLRAAELAPRPGAGSVKLYVAPRPVTTAQFTRLMSPAAGPAARRTGAAAQRPVNSVSYREAREYCRRLTRQLRAAYPGAFKGDLAGYAFRLPRIEELDDLDGAALTATHTPINAEWALSAADDAADAAAPLAARPVRLWVADPKATENRRRPAERTTFRVVLAPTEAGEDD